MARQTGVCDPEPLPDPEPLADPELPLLLAPDPDPLPEGEPLEPEPP